jgi:tRNA(adenine34) deaminase
MYWGKVNRVVYGAADEKNGYRKYVVSCPSIEELGVGPPPFHPKTSLTQGILGDECGILMKEFFKLRR